MARCFSSALLLVLVAACTEAGEPVATDTSEHAVGSLEKIDGFGSNPSQLSMYAYVPADMPPEPRPLVVAMHGCSMSASGYATAGWSALAERWKLYVVYPEQNSAVNNSLGCFNWGGSWPSAPNAFVFNEPLALEDLERGQAENLSIKQMVDYMKDNHAVDDNRVYATGLSAGGGMTAVLLATYPDVFAGGAIVAGIPFGCTILPNATTQHGTDCVNDHPESHELNRTPAGWGDLVRDAYPGYGGPYPRVSIWQGGSDFTVAPELQQELVEQWTNVHGTDLDPDEVTDLGIAERAIYRDGSGRAVVETYYFPTMQHAQPIDSASGCGSTGAFYADNGLCAAEHAGVFFGLDGSGGGGGGGGNGSPDAGPGGGGGNGGGGSSDSDAGTDGPGADSPAGFACRCSGGSGDPLSAFAVLAALILTARRRRTRLHQ